jgi:hypothetical protein
MGTNHLLKRKQTGSALYHHLDRAGFFPCSVPAWPVSPWAVADQAALHGLLNRIRDLNLKLVYMEKKEEQ